jgi:hypothetical protein
VRRFLFISVVLGTLFYAAGVDIIPVRCECCHGVTFHTDLAATLFRGHRDVVHYGCVGKLLKPWFRENEQSAAVAIDSEWAQSQTSSPVDQPS